MPNEGTPRTGGHSADRVRERKAGFHLGSTEGVGLNPRCGCPSPGRTGSRWPGTALELSVCRCRVGAVPVTCSSQHTLPAPRCLSSSPCSTGSPYCSPFHWRPHSRHLPFPAVTVGWIVPDPPPREAGSGLASVGTKCPVIPAREGGESPLLCPLPGRGQARQSWSQRRRAPLPAVCAHARPPRGCPAQVRGVRFDCSQRLRCSLNRTVPWAHAAACVL